MVDPYRYSDLYDWSYGFEGYRVALFTQLPRRVFSETIPVYICSDVHEYSVGVTTDSNFKLRKYLSLRLGWQNAAENGYREAAVAVVPLVCVRFYAAR
jgi:hypothetical protein